VIDIGGGSWQTVIGFKTMILFIASQEAEGAAAEPSNSERGDERNRLDRAAEDPAAARPAAASTPKIKPGTRLLREWQGVVHVIVLETRVHDRGETWPSDTGLRPTD